MQDLQLFLFWLMAGLTGLCALATLVSQNIVRAATWLLFTLGGVAGIFFLLGADVVGAVQLLIYVGGTLVLVIFGVMLTAQGPFITMRTSAVEWGVSLLVGFGLLGVLALGVRGIDRKVPSPELGRKSDPKVPANLRYAPPKNLSKSEPPDKAAARSPYADVLGEGFVGLGVGPAHVEKGQVVRANYLLPFEIVSVHLLVVLIGAAYLARAKRRAVQAQQADGLVPTGLSSAEINSAARQNV
jgi:NADH-quinone oxidoreductase subunit J